MSRGDIEYQGFWARVGREFPDLRGARSTEQYRRDEEALLRQALPSLDGLRILKTDLWDEAKNTRILRWAAQQGARTFGIDISPPIVHRAKAGYAERALALGGVVSDVRALPFTDGSFDAIYSMGTIEHFDETQEAVREIARVLKPGGRAVVGVPNRFDPFLRPVLVAILYRLGLYGYGFEKCYSRRALRRMLETAGLEVIDQGGILFIPGWLRMIDLAIWSWARKLAFLTRWPVAFFDRLSQRFPRLRQHGYLIAAVGRRPR
jgi:SAM-dependent methyltransferase